MLVLFGPIREAERVFDSVLVGRYWLKNRNKVRSEIVVMVFPPIWGEKWRRSEHAHASYPGLFFRPPGFSHYMGREERRVQGLDYAIQSK